MAIRRCKVIACFRDHYALDYCERHYRAERRGAVDENEVKDRPPACSIEGCERDARVHGLCPYHYNRKLKHGDPCAPNLRGKPWTPEQDQRLIDAYRDMPGGILSGARVAPGEIADVALVLDRSPAACSTRLTVLRRQARQRDAVL